ncbi:MAG: hypothetical protein R3C53_11150 [Pirellulaceae bacterium]
MYYLNFWSLLLILCGSSLSLGAEERDEKGNFKIEFPGSVACEKQVQDIRVGANILTVNLFCCQADAGPAYILMYVDYPEAVLKEKLPTSLLDAAAGALLSRISAVRQSSLPVARPGPGQLIRFAGKGKDGDYTGQLCQILVEERLYQMLVLGPHTAMKRHATADFFNSFELLSEK